MTQFTNSTNSILSQIIMDLRQNRFLHPTDFMQNLWVSYHLDPDTIKINFSGVSASLPIVLNLNLFTGKLISFPDRGRTFWIEWAHHTEPNLSFGCDCLIHENVLNIMIFYKKGNISDCIGKVRVDLNEDFSIKDSGEMFLSKHLTENFYEVLGRCYLSCLFLLDLLSCKNVSLITERPTKEKRQRGKIRHPQIEYKTLVIRSLRGKVLSHNSQTHTSNGMRMHLCRGHIRTYTEKSPLFGKYVGQFFIPKHIRGNSDLGQVIKDYKYENQDLVD